MEREMDREEERDTARERARVRTIGGERKKKRGIEGKR